MKKAYTSRLTKRYVAMTEYIIILALVAVGSIAIFTLFGDQIRNVIGDSTKVLSGQAADHDTSKAEGVDGAKSKDMSNF